MRHLDKAGDKRMEEERSSAERERSKGLEISTEEGMRERGSKQTRRRHSGQTRWKIRRVGQSGSQTSPGKDAGGVSTAGRHEIAHRPPERPKQRRRVPGGRWKRGSFGNRRRIACDLHERSAGGLEEGPSSADQNSAVGTGSLQLLWTVDAANILNRQHRAVDSPPSTARGVQDRSHALPAGTGGRVALQR